MNARHARPFRHAKNAFNAECLSLDRSQRMLGCNVHAPIQQILRQARMNETCCAPGNSKVSGQLSQRETRVRPRENVDDSVESGRSVVGSPGTIGMRCRRPTERLLRGASRTPKAHSGNPHKLLMVCSASRPGDPLGPIMKEPNLKFFVAI